MAIVSADIVILPQGAAQAGCTANSHVVESYSDENYTYTLYRFTATPASGWRFVRWQQAYSYQDVQTSGPSVVNASIESTSNPWSAGAISQIGTEEWEDSSYADIPGFRVGFRRIHSLTAVFEAEHQYTGLILRSATSGSILRGASGDILRDD